MTLGPSNYEEAKEAWKKQDEWRRRSARKYEQRLREEGRKFSDLQRSKGLSPVSDKRDEEWERAYGSEDRVEFVRRMGCCVPGCERDAENAHLPGAGGMGYKGDADEIANVCGVHHRTHPDSLHNLGSVERFRERWGVDLVEQTKRVEEAYREHKEAA